MRPSPFQLAPAARDLTGLTGAGVRVAIVDSGIDNSHPAIGGRVSGGAVVDRWENHLVVRDYDGRDVFGHGTAVAGILLEHAPGVELHSFRVLGQHLRSKSEIVLHGLALAVEQGFEVVNCSFGTADLRYEHRYQEILARAYCRHQVIVAACNNQDFRIAEMPSAFPSVVAVDYGRAAPAAPLRFWRREGHLVEYVAPGSEVRVPWLGHGHATVSGSSFAAPLVAAVVCRLLERHRGLRLVELKALLDQLAEPWPDAPGGRP